MEAVGVVFAVGDAGNHADSARGQCFTKRPDRPSAGVASRVKFRSVFWHCLVAVRARMWPMISRPRFCARLALAVVLADQGHQRLRKADEADGERAVLEHLAHLVVPAQLLAVQPHALPHEEGEVVAPSCGTESQSAPAAGRCTDPSCGPAPRRTARYRPWP